MKKNKKNDSTKSKSIVKRVKSFFQIRGIHRRDLLLVLYDMLAVTLAFSVALWFRFDCRFMEIPERFRDAWSNFAPFYAIVSVIIFGLFRLYHSIWKFASVAELERIVWASGVSGIIHIVGITVFFTRMPISYYLIGTTLQFIFIATARFAYRFVSLVRIKNEKLLQSEPESKVMLIGAGDAGQMILRDLQTSPNVKDRVCCIIDDAPDKQGRYLYGVPIVGGREDILFNVAKYKIEKIYLAIPGATTEERRDILDICKETDCRLKSLPGIAEIVSGKITSSQMRDVTMEDLLGRASVKVNMEEIYRFIAGKVILVTGGGGSIGSELCRQIAKHHPKLLIVFDIYENNAHAIGLELKDKFPNLNLEVLIGSVRDSRRLLQVFEKYKPDVVYHAAAHKHVPLMEDSPCESIKNNAIGTYKTAYAAMLYGCKRFVLISTDKAVNPTNIMGASKRLCEMIVQSFDRKIRDGKANEIKPLYLHAEDADCAMPQIADCITKPTTEFVAVRFGNVLGSNGSVVPRFKEQIAKGGPVTVTHPDIIRYFMTIPEAASLVLQAGTYAEGGEIFVLDMGAPVKIDTLARNLIRLSALTPDVDIKIEYTGLRPGEKLYEEKLMSEEGMKKTPNQLIHIGSPIPFDVNEFLGRLQLLMDIAYGGEEDIIHEVVSQVVPTYRHAGKDGSEHKGRVYAQQIKLAEENANLMKM